MLTIPIKNAGWKFSSRHFLFIAYSYFTSLSNSSMALANC